MRQGEYMGTVDKKIRIKQNWQRWWVEVFLNIEKKQAHIGDTVLKIDKSGDLWRKEKCLKTRGVSLERLESGEISRNCPE